MIARASFCSIRFSASEPVAAKEFPLNSLSAPAEPSKPPGIDMSPAGALLLPLLSDPATPAAKTVPSFDAETTSASAAKLPALPVSNPKTARVSRRTILIAPLALAAPAPSEAPSAPAIVKRRLWSSALIVTVAASSTTPAPRLASVSVSSTAAATAALIATDDAFSSPPDLAAVNWITSLLASTSRLPISVRVASPTMAWTLL